MSTALGVGAVVSTIAGLLLRRPGPLLFGMAGIAAAAAAGSIGWALDFRLQLPAKPTNRIRAMQWFFDAVVITCLALAVLDVGR